jgi:hypothetical protein
MYGTLLASAQDCQTTGVSNQTVVITDNESLSTGDVVRVIGEDEGVCSGSYTVQSDDENIGITSWATDPVGGTVGLSPGEEFNITVNGETVQVTEFGGDSPVHIYELTFQTDTIVQVSSFETINFDEYTIGWDESEVLTGSTFRVDIDILPTSGSVNSYSLTLSGDITDEDTFSALTGTTIEERENGEVYIAGFGLDSGGSVLQLIGTLNENRTIQLTGGSLVVEQNGDLFELTLNEHQEIVDLIYLLLGDADMNGQIDMADLQLVVYHILLCDITGDCLTEDQFIRADITENGAVTLIDAARIYMLINQ